MLNFTLATIFYFYFSNFHCSYFQKELLVHSKYTGNSEIVVIRIRRRMKFPLLTFSTKS